MRIYLDDARPCPEGWVLCRWPSEVISALNVDLLAQVNNNNTGDLITHISLDHDLGDDERGTGYDVLLWIEEKVVVDGFNPPKLSVHSSNPSACQKMWAAIESINKRRVR